MKSIRPHRLVDLGMGCCGSIRKGPFCGKCGQKIDPLKSLMCYITDRIEDMQMDPERAPRLEQWIEWQASLFKVVCSRMKHPEIDQGTPPDLL